MNGLIAKDIFLLKQRKQAILLMAIILCMMGLSMDSLFMTSYATLVFGIMAVGTVSYDDADNGYAFLMTLPITVKEYVREKFLFCGMITVAGWGLGMVLSMVMGLVKGSFSGIFSNIEACIAPLPILAALMYITLAVQLKYGTERSRLVLGLIGGFVFVFAMIMSKIDIAPSTTEEMVRMLDACPDCVIICGLLVIFLSIVAICYNVSVRVMEHKEY